MPDTTEFYSHPARFTEPGNHADALASLPADPAALAEVVHGLILHEHMAGMYGFEMADERRASVHIRPVSRLLDQITGEDDRPLDVPREPSARVPGNCRHFTVLTVAALRAHGVPARARCGFGGYFGTGWYEDHWVCEYWNATQGRWILADAQIDDVQRKVFGLTMDVYDLSRDAFVVAGDAWLRCRAGLADPGKFGLSAMNEAGYWWIAANLLRDVAALNNTEMLPWDIWGEMLRPDEEPSPAQTGFFDQLALLSSEPDAGFADLTARYRADPRLTVPASVFNGVLQRVDEV
ncbi:MAG TPA: transglutaminase-like domain-containing protein [Streptosporangiaceae bacterium]|nr:transglutaminase-like domain-containing protein [Streptosporangiaceae bacterium]